MSPWDFQPRALVIFSRLPGKGIDSVEKRRVQVTMQGCKQLCLRATKQMWSYLAEACSGADERGSVKQTRVQVTRAT